MSAPVTAASLVLAGLFIAYPLFALVTASLYDGGVTLAYYQALAADTALPAAVKNTLLMSLVSTLAAAMIGAVGAWLTERVRLPVRQLWRLLFVFPVLVPSYVLSIAWQHWAGPVGLVNKMATGALGVPLWRLEGLAGITFVMAISHAPIIYLLVRSALNAIPAELEEASRIAGAGPVKVFRTVTLPLVFPAIAGGCLLAFASAIDNFGIPAFIGIPSGVTVLSTLIYQKVIGLGSGQFEQAAALAVVTAIAAIVPVYLNNAFFKAARYRQEGAQRSVAPAELGRGKVGCMLLLVLWHALVTVGPFVAMVLVSLTAAYGVPLSLSTLSLAHYSALFSEVSAVKEGLLNSLLLAAGTTLGVLLLAWPVARGSSLKAGAVYKWLDAIGAIPYCLPGMVVGLAVLMAWLRPIPGVDFSFYGGLALLFLAYLPRFFTFGVRAWSAAWSRFSTALEDAGRVAGAGALKVIWRIILPLFRGEALGAMLLIFLLAFTELTLSAILAGSQSRTLGVVLFGLEAAGSALESAALGTLITLFSIILAYFAARFVLGGRSHEY